MMEKKMIEEIGFLEEVQRIFGESKLRPEQYSALALAYIGDAVYDLIIRTIILDTGNNKVKNYHRMTSAIVNAASQARLVESISELLTDEEEKIFRHGRNVKSSTSAKNASIVDYRIATGFEALIGYLYLKKETERMIFLVRSGLEKTGQMDNI